MDWTCPQASSRNPGIKAPERMAAFFEAVIAATGPVSTAAATDGGE